MKHVYFVSYQYFHRSEQGFGRCEITLNKPITSVSEFNDIEMGIMNDLSFTSALSNVVILNFVLLRVE